MLLDQARFRFKAANGGDHKDIDRVDLFPIPAFIIANKFDTFKDCDRYIFLYFDNFLKGNIKGDGKIFEIYCAYKWHVIVIHF